MEKIRIIRKISVLILLLVIAPLISAAENQTVSQREANQCINNSFATSDQLKQDGFNTLRIQDNLKITNELLNAQIAREKKNLSFDYQPIIDSCNNIEKIKNFAYNAKDELFVLNKEYLNFQEKIKGFDVNTTEVEILMRNINQSMSDERYENVIEQIPIISNKIAEVQASATTVNLFYKTASRGIKQIIIDNLYTIIVIFVILITLLIVYRLYLRRKIMENQIKKLEVEKKALQEMIKRIQKEYFEEGKMAEGEYNIRTKKFAELIRDIERKIPLLKEEIAMMGPTKSTTAEFEKKIYKRKK
jgi:protein-disulfide isomerase-like protein with CxxC motif